MSSSRRSGAAADSSASDGTGLDVALTLRADERDNRFLAGGNFFGRESVEEPELEPMAVDRMLMEQIAAAQAAAAAKLAAAPKSSAGGSSSGQQQPPLILKLPGGKKS